MNVHMRVFCLVTAVYFNKQCSPSLVKVSLVKGTSTLSTPRYETKKNISVLLCF